MQSSHQQSWQAQEKQRGRARLARDLRRLAIVLALLVLAAILLVFLFPPFFAPQTHLVLLGSQNRDNFNAPPIAFVGEDLLALESIQEAKVSNHSELWGAAHTAKGLGKHLGNVGYHYGSHDQLREHLQNFVDAYNHAKRLKTLKGLTPFEHIVKCWMEKPKGFKLNPTHHMPGLNT